MSQRPHGCGKRGRSPQFARARKTIVALCLCLTACMSAFGNPDPDSVARACQGCRIDFSPMLSLGENATAGEVPEWPIVAFNGQRALLVSRDRDAVLDLGLDGTLRTVHGSAGDGPGELRGVDGIAWGGAGSFLAHRSDGRVIEFGSDGASVDHPSIEPGCVLGSGGMTVVCVGEGGPDVRSPSVRVKSVAGNQIADFVPSPGRLQDGRCVMCRALTAMTRDNALWAVSRRFHRVELWERTGRINVSVDLTSVLERIVTDSIGDGEPGQLRTIGVVPMPSVGGVAIIDGFVRKSDLITTPVIAEVNGVRVQSEAMSRLMEVRPVASIVSVIDSLGELVGLQLFRGRTLLPAGDEFVAELRESADGLPVVVLGALVLNGMNGSR